MSKVVQQTSAEWFHLFKDMIQSGDAAKIGGPAVLVYLVIKTYVDFTTGRSFPSIELISEKSGLSDRQVMRHLKTLCEFGYVEKESSPGKLNVYRPKEKFQTINKETGEVESVITFDYIPNAVRAAQTELKNFLVSGNVDGLQYIKIDSLHLTVNVQNIAKGDGIVYNIEDTKDPQLKAQIRQLEEARKRAKEAALREAGTPDMGVTP